MDGLTNTSPQAKPATSFQQKQFDLLLGRARQMMGANGEEWIQAIKADPITAAVTMGTSTVRELVKMSEKAGQKVDPAVLLHVGIQFVKDIAGVANAAGVVPDDGLEAFLKDVMSQSIMEYLKLDAQDGLISPKAKGEAKGMLAKMQGEGAAEMPGDGPGPDDMAPHEDAEAPPVETAEGEEEDDPAMAAELEAIRARKGALK